MQTGKLHEIGERCPVVELAKERFGDELGMYLLWEETCFPFSDTIAMNQLKYLITKADRGEDPVLDGWVEERQAGALSR